MIQLGVSQPLLPVLRMGNHKPVDNSNNAMPEGFIPRPFRANLWSNFQSPKAVMVINNLIHTGQPFPKPPPQHPHDTWGQHGAD